MKVKLTIDKQIVEITMSEDATVEDLRSVVADNKKVAASRIRLIFKAQILTKNERLKDLNIKENDSIIVSIRKVFFLRSPLGR